MFICYSIMSYNMTRTRNLVRILRQQDTGQKIHIMSVRLTLSEHLMFFSTEL